MTDDLIVIFERADKSEIDWKEVILRFAEKYEKVPVGHSQKTLGNLVTDFVSRQIKKSRSCYKPR